MASRALTVAAAAGVLLVAVVAVDASMNRVFHLEAQLGGNWVKVATYPYQHGSRYYEPSLAAFDLNASEQVPFRVRVENGYPWTVSEDVEVTMDGRPVHQGRLEADRFTDGVAPFAIPAQDLLRGGGAGGRPVADPPEAPASIPHFWVRVGAVQLGGSLAFREVAR